MRTWCDSATISCDQRLTRLLLLRHRLEDSEEQPLWQRAREGLVQRDVGHRAKGDADDLNFDRNLLTTSAAAKGNGFGHDLGSGMATVSKTGFYRSSQLLPLEQLLCRFYCPF